MGRSGSGKSTLLKLLLKELEPTSGQIIVNDMDLEKMPRRYIPKYRRRLGMVFQDFRLLKDKTVYENVAFAQRVIGVSPREIKKNVPEMLLEQLSIVALRRHEPARRDCARNAAASVASSGGRADGKPGCT